MFICVNSSFPIHVLKIIHSCDSSDSCLVRFIVVVPFSEMMQHLGILHRLESSFEFLLHKYTIVPEFFLWFFSYWVHFINFLCPVGNLTIKKILEVFSGFKIPNLIYTLQNNLKGLKLFLSNLFRTLKK